MRHLTIVHGLLPLVSAICYRSPHLHARSEFSPPSFGYTGLQGPLNWHGLSADNIACAQGTHQSPIVIDSTTGCIPAVAGDSLSIELESYPRGTEIENRGTTIEVPANGTITRNGKEHRLVQFHFHTPSEHRIDEESYAVEAHFVFRAEGKFEYGVPRLHNQHARRLAILEFVLSWLLALCRRRAEKTAQAPRPNHLDPGLAGSPSMLRF